jgi:hypothetical protein
MYPLREALFLVVCGTIAGGGDYDDIVDWSEAHFTFLRGFAGFHFGIPCVDWLRCIMNCIDLGLFLAWVAECVPDKHDLVAIDGKAPHPQSPHRRQGAASGVGLRDQQPAGARPGGSRPSTPRSKAVSQRLRRPKSRKAETVGKDHARFEFRNYSVFHQVNCPAAGFSNGLCRSGARPLGNRKHAALGSSTSPSARTCHACASATAPTTWRRRASRSALERGGDITDVNLPGQAGRHSSRAITERSIPAAGLIEKARKGAQPGLIAPELVEGWRDGSAARQRYGPA